MCCFVPRRLRAADSKVHHHCDDDNDNIDVDCIDLHTYACTA